jgi:dTDP-4-amino-4,6-dideoxygalactose transaminase
LTDRLLKTETLLEKSGFFGSRQVVFAGRGATALSMLYEALAPVGGRVLLPALTCPSLLATTYLTSRKPIIIDVDRNFNIDPVALEREICPGDLVVAIHLFGIPCEIDKLQSICDSHDATLIEDAAQAIGGTINGKPIGTYGAASVLSFAGGKILPTCGGGAILTDNPDLYNKLKSAQEKLPDRPPDLSERAKALRDSLTGAFNMARSDDPDEAKIWRYYFEKHGDIYRYSINDIELDSISNEIGGLEEIAIERRHNLGIYLDLLKDVPIHIPDYTDHSCPYRFSFVVPHFTGTHTQYLTKVIRNYGLPASNLHVPLNWLSPDLHDYKCSNAHDYGLRIINLWLDSPEAITLACSLVIENV